MSYPNRCSLPPENPIEEASSQKYNQGKALGISRGMTELPGLTDDGHPGGATGQLPAPGFPMAEAFVRWLGARSAGLAVPSARQQHRQGGDQLCQSQLGGGEWVLNGIFDEIPIWLWVDINH